MDSFFFSHPLGTFLAGIALTAGGMGGAVAYYRRRARGLAWLLAAMLDSPEKYERARRAHWLPPGESEAAQRKDVMR